MSSLKYVVAAVLFVGLLIGGAMLMNQLIIPNTAYTDSLPVHSGCSAFWGRTSPYDESVTLRTQTIIQEGYDPFYDPVVDPHRFAYPAHTCLILAPLWTMPYDMMAPIWMFLNFMFFAALPILFMVQVVRYKMPIWQAFLLILLSLFFWRYSMITVIFAQYVGWVLLCLVGAIWAIINRRNMLSALFIVGLTIRPGGAFFAIALLLYVLYEKRYRTLVLFAAMMLALWVISLLMVGPWILDFLSGLVGYTSYREDVGWLPLRLGIVPGIAYLIFMFGATFFVLRSAWQENRTTFLLWGMSALVLLELILLPQTNGYTLVYALLPILMVAYAFRSSWLTFVIASVSMAMIPWLWSLWLRDFLPTGVEQLYIPTAIMLVLLIAWWFGERRVVLPSEQEAT